MKTRMTRLLSAIAAWAAPLSVYADPTARQSFMVHVPPRISITAPPVAARATLLPDQTQVQFTPQAWDIVANSPSGATVQFVTEHSFHNQDDSSIRRDAQLELQVMSQSQFGAWTVTQSQAVTAHQVGDESATVQVHTIKPGSAVLGLTVTFLQGDELSTPGGDYLMTIVGTITSN